MFALPTSNIPKVISAFAFLCLLCIILFENELFAEVNRRYRSKRFVTKAELKIDKTVFGKDVKAKNAQKTNPNLPLVFYYSINPKDYKLNESCAYLTNPMDISFNNVYWQVQKMTNDIYYLFGAYFDNRKLNGVGPVVRVMGLLQHWEPKVKPFCQMWFNNQTTPVITQVFSFNMLWNHFWGPEANIMQPYFITCKVPPSMNGSVPVAVSVVEQPCENATNLLRVIYDPLPPGQEQKDFAVCAKGLFYKHNPNMAVRIVEWVELLKILGAEKIGLYYYHIHENITKVFNYYEESGFMDVGQVTVPGKYPNAPDLVAGFLETHRRFEFILEVIHYTDCMYHKMYRYKFIAILDVDEVIVPHSANTWREMLFQKPETLTSLTSLRSRSSCTLTFHSIFTCCKTCIATASSIQQVISLVTSTSSAFITLSMSSSRTITTPFTASTTSRPIAPSTISIWATLFFITTAPVGPGRTVKPRTRPRW
ncbi:uncharacterized protein LOC132204460 isoform X2 [Neocloeon triangulifer]|uniref:uncharacterized protein LOC132204460 isoform X2 n=1 Tax=Neocloeon triangulifer TaxID=2078957 RepID=UPI00286EFDB2|nr:uncharacterized protein LOC132204460 isoform X2 [Neocloeon triangulifer]